MDSNREEIEKFHYFSVEGSTIKDLNPSFLFFFVFGLYNQIPMLKTGPPSFSNFYFCYSCDYNISRPVAKHTILVCFLCIGKEKNLSAILYLVSTKSSNKKVLKKIRKEKTTTRLEVEDHIIEQLWRILIILATLRRRNPLSFSNRSFAVTVL